MVTKLDNKLIYNLTIKEWNNYSILNFSLVGTPYYLVTNEDKVLIFTHCNKLGDIKERKRVHELINKFQGYEIELICCYPNLAKEDYELGKYIKIDSDRQIQMTFSHVDKDNTFIQYAHILEKIED